MKKKKKKRIRKPKTPFWALESRFHKFMKYVPLFSLPVFLYLYFIENIPLYAQNAPFNGIVPMAIAFIVIYILAYALGDLDGLTDNVQANRTLSPVVGISVLSYLMIKRELYFFDESQPFYGAFLGTVVFLAIYLYSNSYFQPDLDVSGKRPGLSHFPFGQWIAYWPWGRLLKQIAYPITYLWNKLWHPYASLFTHRGVGHYPIIGVWLRVGYLYLMTGLLEVVLNTLQIQIPYLENINNYFLLFFPKSDNWTSIEFFILCFPIFLSDFIHITVDYLDSVKRGLSFCPPKIPRGLLAQMFNEVKTKRKRRRSKKK